MLARLVVRRVFVPLMLSVVVSRVIGPGQRTLVPDWMFWIVKFSNLMIAGSVSMSTNSSSGWSTIVLFTMAVVWLNLSPTELLYMRMPENRVVPASATE